MATILGLKKAVQEIALDESPNSPVYTLNLTDKGIAKKLYSVATQFGEFQKLGEGLRNCKGDEEAERLFIKTSELYKEVIAGILGDVAYSEIIEYVGCGEDAANLNMVLTPLVNYLFVQVFDTLNANDKSAVGKYLQESDAAAAL